MRTLNRFAGQTFANTLAVGDSIFAGVGDGTPLDYIQTPRNIVTEAQSGRTLGTMNSNLTTWLTENPGYDLLLHGGLNDFDGGAGLTTVQNRLTGCVAQAEIQGRAVAFLGITPCEDYGGWTATEWQRCLDFNAWAGDYLKSRDLRHVFIDPQPAMQDNQNRGSLPTEYKATGGTDPIHLSVAGAQRLAQVIDAMLGEARKMRRAA